MLTYYVTILLVFLLMQKAQKAKEREVLLGIQNQSWKSDANLAFWTAATIMIFVSGMRYGVGADFFAYAHSFYERKYEFIKCLLTLKEPGFGLLNSIARTIYNDYIVLFTLCALVTIGLCFGQIRKYSDDFLFSALLFIFIGTWHGSFNAVRQYLAMACVFWGHRYIFERNFLKYVFFIFLAMSFHKTALMMLPIFFIVGQKKQKIFWIALIAFACAIYFSYDRLFDIMSEIKGKAQGETEYALRTVNFVRVLIAFAPLAVPFFYPSRKYKEPETNFYMKLLGVNAMFMLATRESSYLARVGIYSDIFAVLAFPKIMYAIPKKAQQFFKVVALGLYAIFWYIEITGRATLCPFVWVFER